MKHNYPVRGNQHLFALGVANVFGSFFKCYPASGSLSRSVALEDAGARTNVSSLVTASILLFTLLCLTSLFQDLPKSILAAIIFVALKNMFLRVRVIRSCARNVSTTTLRCGGSHLLPHF